MSKLVESFDAAVQRILAAAAAGDLQSAGDKAAAAAQLRDALASAGNADLLAVCEEAEAQLQQLGRRAGWNRRVASLSKMLAERVREARIEEARAEMRSRDDTIFSCLGDMPAAVDTSLLMRLKVPYGYRIDDTGVWQVMATTEGAQDLGRVATAPIFVIGASSDIHSQDTILTVVWKTAYGDWVKRHVDRGVVCDARSLVKLSRAGAPVTSSTSAELVKWLAAFENENGEVIPRRYACSRLGWVTVDGKLDFVLPEGTVLNSPVEVVSPPGMDSMASQWAPKGTLEGCFQVFEKLRNKPVVMAAAYTVLAAPMLPLLGQQARGFIVDFSGVYESGKTTLLLMAMSLCGRPAENGLGCVYGWDNKRVWMEMTAGYLHNLPFCLNDTRNAPHPRDRSCIDWAYQLELGEGKGRGAVEGVRQTQTWWLTGLSSGEMALAEMGQAGGARTRVISVKESPFGAKTRANEKLIDECMALIEQHHGVFFRYYLRTLAGSAEWRDACRQYYRNAIERMRTMKSLRGGGAIRMTRHIAALETAGWAAHQMGLPAPDPEFDPVAVLIRSTQVSLGKADIATEALSSIHAWAGGEAHRFWGRHSPGHDGMARPPNGGWLGAWAHDREGEPWRWIGVFEHRLESQLKAMGYDQPAEVIDRWKEREWLVPNRKVIGGKTESRWTWPTRVGHANLPMVRLARAAIEEA